MGAFHQLPPRIPEGQNLSCDEVKLHRDVQPASATNGAFAQAWELVKEKPAEALILSFLTLLFNGGGGGCNGGDFSSLLDSDSGGSDDYQYESYDYGGAIFDSGYDVLAAIGGAEFAIIAGVLAFALVLGVVFFVIGTIIRGGGQIFWLRHVRGQNAEFGSATSVTKFIAPLLVSNLLVGLAVFGGFLLLIIPGIVITLGLYFVNMVVVDKNIGYVDALRASWRLTDGYKMDLLVFAILAGLLNFAGVLACCVGVIVTNAVTMGAMTIIYDRIAEPGNAYLDGEIGDMEDVFS